MEQDSHGYPECRAMDVLQFITTWSGARRPGVSGDNAVSLLAHQGGWDEILLVAGPIAVIVALLAIVKRRIDARIQPMSDEDRASGTQGSGSVDGDPLDTRTDSA